ncbi:MAG: hypothetical protein D8M57_05660 [Candidatus Scalindua sp. AMX11]|nr:MAG: hypothetical protein DWQ00_02025 [Candidatus Scalindua sp.]NOG82825.1 hypothetical protein [Planctomycetota bacterium]RZV86174.1 MAG: hypothetical protein EX341_07335 [Candidatus Scalindua sp. SCAELEC01]TDE65793.1 MAG: hypothetical protein D8M57_05660 [Candidatus Scalindua sp. AMX11]GJQ58296.1 MAG: hypothetical protein SCALA701_10970 [Candidatus Scalindua sp.]
MKRLNWYILLGVILLALSTLFYVLHYLVFKDIHHIFIFLIGDIAFVFIEVLMVTLIIHRVFEDREKKALQKHMNIFIGAFFSEVGIKLLGLLSKWDPQIERIQQGLIVEEETAEQKFRRVCRYLRKHDFSVEREKPDWETLKTFLVEKKDYLLRLLENPNLLEHESFTDLLWAVFHMAEEFDARKDFDYLPKEDYEHLHDDTERVYGQLALQWLKYMEHLIDSYPYLFSLSMRTNPFDPRATPIVQKSQ